MTARVIDRHPAVDRFDALAFGGLAIMAGMAFGFVSAAAVGWARTPGGWLLVLVFATPGLVPVARWAVRTHRPGTYYLRAVPPGWQPAISAIASSANELDDLAAQAHEGPIAEHLDEASQQATSTLEVMYRTATGAAERDRVPRLALTAASDLSRLTVAARRLSIAHDGWVSEHEGSERPISDLADRTERLAEVLETWERTDAS